MTKKKDPSQHKPRGRKAKDPAATPAVKSVSRETTPVSIPAEVLEHPAPPLADQVKKPVAGTAVILSPANQLKMFPEKSNELELKDLLEKIELLKAKKVIAGLEKEIEAIGRPGKISIQEAIIEVRKKTGTVKKSGRNTFSNYSYAMAGDVIEHVREAVNEAGILIYPCAAPKNEIKDGKLLTFTQWFKLTGPDGSFINVPIPTAGHDSLDKAPFKANTGALKYVLITVFLLPTGDDPEANNPAEKPTAPPQNQTAPKQTQPPATKKEPETPKTQGGTNAAPAGNTTEPGQQENPDKKAVNPKLLQKIKDRIAAGDYTPEFRKQLAAGYSFTPEQGAEIKAAIEAFKKANPAENQRPANNALTPAEAAARADQEKKPAAAMAPVNAPAMQGGFEPPKKDPITPENFNAVLAYINKGENKEAFAILNNASCTPAQQTVIDATFKKSKAGNAAPAAEPGTVPFKIDPIAAGPGPTSKQQEEIIQLMNSCRDLTIITRAEKAAGLAILHTLNETQMQDAIEELKEKIILNEEPPF